MAIVKFYYQDQLFAMHEIFAEVVAQLICETMEESELSGYSENARGFYGYCDQIRSGERQGDPEFLLDEYVSNVEHFLELNDICSKTITRLQTFDKIISLEYLNKMETAKVYEHTRRSWTRPIMTNNMITVFQLIQELIAGKCRINKKEVNFTGWTPNPVGYNLP